MYKNNTTNIFWEQRIRKDDAKLLRQTSSQSPVSALTSTTTANNNNNNNNNSSSTPLKYNQQILKSLPLTEHVLRDNEKPQIPTTNSFTVTNTKYQQQQVASQKKTFPLNSIQNKAQQQQAPRHGTSSASVCSQSSAGQQCKSNNNNNKHEDSSSKSLADETTSPRNEQLLQQRTSKVDSWIHSVPTELPPIPNKHGSSSSSSVYSSSVAAGSNNNVGNIITARSSKCESIFSATTLSHHAASSAMVSGVTSINRRLEAIEERIAGEKELRNELRKALQEVRSIVEKQKLLDGNFKKSLTGSAVGSNVSGGSRKIYV